MSKDMVANKTTADLLREKENLFLEIANAHGELSDEFELKLLENVNAIAVKADSIQYVVKKLEAEEQFLKDQAKAYSDAAKARANTVKRIRERIKNLMIEFGETSIKGLSTEFYTTAARQGLEVDGLPDGYTMVVTETVADKDRIREALERGETIPGCRLTNGTALRTRVTVTK